jgi:hypothetical protein
MRCPTSGSRPRRRRIKTDAASRAARAHSPQTPRLRRRPRRQHHHEHLTPISPEPWTLPVTRISFRRRAQPFELAIAGDRGRPRLQVARVGRDPVVPGREVRDPSVLVQESGSASSRPGPSQGRTARNKRHCATGSRDVITFRKTFGSWLLSGLPGVPGRFAKLGP